MQEVEEYINRYLKFIKVIRGNNKSEFESKNTCILANNLLDSLIEVIKSGNINLVDNYIIYNTLLLTRLYLRYIPRSKVFSKRKYLLDRIYIKLEMINNLSIKMENYKIRH